MFRSLVCLFLCLLIALAAAGPIKPKKPPCKVLVMSGGGSYGVFEAGVLQMLSDKHDGKLDYDYMTGISAGAINAVFLSTFEKGPGPFQDAIKQLRTLWLSLKNSDVYKNSPLGPFRTQSIYNTEPLRATLKRFLSSRPQPLTVERGVTIGTSDLASGMMKYVDAELLQTDPVGWAMASSAIPIAFEPQHINGSVFVDGGTLSNEIIAPGVKSCPADSEVEVDVILCSPRIGKLPPETVAKFGFGAVAGRVLEMVQQQLSNHVLDFRCDEDERSNVKVTLYTPTGDDNGISALDFTKASFIWNAGYNRSVVDEWYYCPVRGGPRYGTTA